MQKTYHTRSHRVTQPNGIHNHQKSRLSDEIKLVRMNNEIEDFNDFEILQEFTKFGDIDDKGDRLTFDGFNFRFSEIPKQNEKYFVEWNCEGCQATATSFFLEDVILVKEGSEVYDHDKAYESEPAEKPEFINEGG